MVGTDNEESAKNFCGSMCLPYVRSVESFPLGCRDLKEWADRNGVSDPDAEWTHKAICQYAKGVLAALVLCMLFALVGFLMCFCVAHRPRLVVVPGILCTILAGIAVMVYAIQVSSTYPWQAAQLWETEAISVGSEAASQKTANVRSGFALAIAGSVISFVVCLLTAMARAQNKNLLAGQEMHVISAIPYSGPSVEAQPFQLITATVTNAQSMPEASEVRAVPTSQLQMPVVDGAVASAPPAPSNYGGDDDDARSIAPSMAPSYAPSLAINVDPETGRPGPQVNGFVVPPSRNGGNEGAEGLRG
mmetsp:Transcript_29516/g.46304  ORF Transcript_29516/g.46304 Transcript_29516/m.46304 type:complete len:304 (-) Transcript_29516:239-1150(-)